jgi:hypothetical protein
MKLHCQTMRCFPSVSKTNPKLMAVDNLPATTEPQVHRVAQSSTALSSALTNAPLGEGHRALHAAARRSAQLIFVVLFIG